MHTNSLNNLSKEAVSGMHEKAGSLGRMQGHTEKFGGEERISQTSFSHEHLQSTWLASDVLVWTRQSIPTALSHDDVDHPSNTKVGEIAAHDIPY